MTRTADNRVARENTPHETLETYIRRRALRAEVDFGDAKNKFAEALDMNSSCAIQRHAKTIVHAQTRHVWWKYLLAMVAKHGERAAITFAKEDADRQIDSFFASNSTCAWHNVMRRAEAETYNDLLRHTIPELEELAKECSR